MCGRARLCASAVSAVGLATDDCISCLRSKARLNNKRLLRLLPRGTARRVRKRGGRKRALGTRATMALPQGQNQRRSRDFVSDALASGRRFRVRAIVEDLTRECLGLVVDTEGSSLSHLILTNLKLHGLCLESGRSELQVTHPFHSDCGRRLHTLAHQNTNVAT